jgi:methionine synthase I (cobalamin-dependent)/5,10-methylenetetrahydrofolate reductase
VRPDVRERLAAGVLVFDGAMGTQLYERGIHLGRCFDALNLEDPDLVRQVHRDYREAGAQVLQTNTFGANAFKLGTHHLAAQLAEINQQGARLARECAGDDVLVAGSMGPLGMKIEPWGPTSREEVREAFRRQAEALLAGGVDLFSLETFASPEELSEAVRGARSAAPAVPILAQLTLDERGQTFYGLPIEEAVRIVEAARPDAVGLNCTVGPELMLEALEKLVAATALPIAVRPNAGFPKQVDQRYFYLSSPDYFGRYGLRFAEAGARIVGGCCGTTPEHIRSLARALRAVQPSSIRARVAAVPAEVAKPEAAPVPLAEKSALAGKIARGEFVATVELLPPRGWGLAALLRTTEELESAGVDAVNIPDGPRATARMSPLATAVRIQERRGGIEALLHYVCRDRNLIGMQADLLGAYALGLRNLLLLTGDTIVKGDYPDATPVFDIDSIGLTNLVRRLNEGFDVGGRSIGRPTGFLIGVGANPTALSFEREVDRFYWKVDAGAEYAITQPVFDTDSLERFLDAIADFPAPVLAGIWPLQSLRNAEFLNNEVPGVAIPTWIMERMRAVAGSPEAEREEGLAIALEMARRVLPRVCGLQIAAPFNRGESARRLLQLLAGDVARLFPREAPPGA